MDKKVLSDADLEAASAIELPDRNLMACHAVIGCITISNVHVCVAAAVLSTTGQVQTNC